MVDNLRPSAGAAGCVGSAGGGSLKLRLLRPPPYASWFNDAEDPVKLGTPPARCMSLLSLVLATTSLYSLCSLSFLSRSLCSCSTRLLASSSIIILRLLSSSALRLSSTCCLLSSHTSSSAATEPFHRPASRPITRLLACLLACSSRCRLTCSSFKNAAFCSRFFFCLTRCSGSPSSPSESASALDDDANRTTRLTREAGVGMVVDD